ncbi:hypothetical protein JQS43_24775 [Natronosporangium hydrolyticum]|uniref:DUF1440 domain-containing protein n=1 Tax=Natronosporangium hydrolyticum TaxID=2811111 RepID=A0A895YL91_9ACTN|nr:hypothetical protein [Natronosporangium hydrolyticum]QSB14638.1 hypothetical protein JQS43_24775 [Natronosporangium hydrolyticum]
MTHHPYLPVIRAGARGAIAAMAMTGLRRLTTTLGWVERTPPERVLRQQAPRLLGTLPPGRRPALVESAHIAYGVAGGVMFGALPDRFRRRHRHWLGPAYGALFWGAYQLVISPLLGLPRAEHRRAEQLALLTDHVLYGVVVAAAPWPYRD